MDDDENKKERKKHPWRTYMNEKKKRKHRRSGVLSERAKEYLIKEIKEQL